MFNQLDNIREERVLEQNILCEQCDKVSNNTYTNIIENNNKNTIENEIKKKQMIQLINQHVIFFPILAMIVFYLSNILSSYSLSIFQLCLFPSTYNYLNGTLSTFNFIGGAIVSTFVGYGVMKLLGKYLSDVYIIGVISFLTIFAMTLTNTLNISTLSYSLMAPKLMSSGSNDFRYLFSFLIGIFIAIISYQIYAFFFNQYIQPYLANVLGSDIKPIIVKGLFSQNQNKLGLLF